MDQGIALNVGYQSLERKSVSVLFTQKWVSVAVNSGVREGSFVKLGITALEIL